MYIVNFHYGFIGYFLNVLAHIIILNAIKNNNMKEININILFIIGYSYLSYEKYCQIYENEETEQSDIFKNYSIGHVIFFIYYLYKKFNNKFTINKNFDDFALIGHMLLIQKEKVYNSFGRGFQILFYMACIFDLFESGEFYETHGSIYLTGMMLLIYYYLSYFL